MAKPQSFRILGMDCAEEVAILRRDVGPGPRSARATNRSGHRMAQPQLRQAGGRRGIGEARRPEHVGATSPFQDCDRPKPAAVPVAGSPARIPATDARQRTRLSRSGLPRRIREPIAVQSRMSPAFGTPPRRDVAALGRQRPSASKLTACSLSTSSSELRLIPRHQCTCITCCGTHPFFPR
jgi:hypothetical protein